MDTSGDKNFFDPSIWERKVTPVFRNLSHLPETKDLKTAAIGKNRILPIHKAMNPAGFMNQILTGPQNK